MHTTVADANGGKNVQLTAAQETKIIDEWKANEAEAAREAKAAAAEKLLEDQAMEALTANLTPELRDALKKKLSFS